MEKCPICTFKSTLFTTVPFSKNCTDLEIATDQPPVDYYMCDNCNFVFSPKLMQFSNQQLKELIYNEEYSKFDPEFDDVRPQDCLRIMSNMIPDNIKHRIKHLDFGSGSGELVKLLRKNGWDSYGHDPYIDPPLIATGKYELITAFEVFEHATDINNLLKEILGFLAPGGTILFSTAFGCRGMDKNWWYIAPRNGHISILSQQAITVLCLKFNLQYKRLLDTIHIMKRV